jgi:hypothetical protein
MGGQRIDTRSPTGKLMLTMLGAIAAFERDLMLKRQREGIARAAVEGKYKGRAPTARAKAADVLRMAKTARHDRVSHFGRGTGDRRDHSVVAATRISVPGVRSRGFAKRIRRHGRLSKLPQPEQHGQCAPACGPDAPHIEPAHPDLVRRSRESVLDLALLRASSPKCRQSRAARHQHVRSHRAPSERWRRVSGTDGLQGASVATKKAAAGDHGAR